MLTQNLAIFGAKPLFERPLNVGTPNIGDRKVFDRYIDEMFERKWLTNRGPLVCELEERLRDYLGVEDCVAFSNATSALEILIKAFDLKGSVIVPAFTFVATVHVLQWFGIRPIFCDIDPTTHNIDANQVEKLIAADTSAILGVHIWGRPCAVAALQDIADRHGIPLLFDAAHAFGAAHNDLKIGHFGHAEVFSFHATKIINSFEGGAIATNDKELAARLRLMQNFGFRGMDNVGSLGINGKMSEAAAAMALTSLDSLDSFISRNKENYNSYNSFFSDIPGITLASHDWYSASNYHYVVIEIEESEFGLHRNTLMHILHAENVVARRYFFPGCHRMEPYRSLYDPSNFNLKNTEGLLQRVLCFPNGSQISQTNIDAVASKLRLCAHHASEIKERLVVRFGAD